MSDVLYWCKRCDKVEIDRERLPDCWIVPNLANYRIHNAVSSQVKNPLRYKLAHDINIERMDKSSKVL